MTVNNFPTYLPRIVWIACNYSTAMKIPRKYKGFTGDPGHHSNCFILTTIQYRTTPLQLPAPFVKLIREIPI